MSLRWRLIGLVAVALVISLCLGIAIACLNASRSVGIEMEAALTVTRRMVENAADGIRASHDPQRALERLVDLFKDNRHLRVSLAGDPMTVAAPAIEKSPFGRVPSWFVRLINVPSVADRVSIAIPGRPDAEVVIETDPRNETLDVWGDFSNTVIILVLFSAQTILLIYLFIGRALRPLYRLAAALEQIGHGRYATRVGGRPASELAQLDRSFNRMADQLAAADADKRRLHEQLLTLQEQERAEIARDLHDEVGPHLFAINVDAANAARLVKEGRPEEAAEQLRLIPESVDHMQRELRSVVRRLRPIGLAEFGLPDAIEHMIQFWRRRHPDIAFRIGITPDCGGLGELLDTTIYRIVQECVSNALRHGRPSAISVRIEHDSADERVMLEIADDGSGVSEAANAGFGLRGMAERVRAIGGRLTLRNTPGGGLTVTAVLPCRAEREFAAAQPENDGR
jgi:two-component system sensor histidine kinase UhpB